MTDALRRTATFRDVPLIPLAERLGVLAFTEPLLNGTATEQHWKPEQRRWRER